MNYDEFAFFNQQLAGMLKSGLPLEGALRQLCANLRQGPLRLEIEELEADLAKGLPLREALPKRGLPEFYRQMVLLGAQGQKLPEMLTLLADYYQRRHLLWTRLKGLMVYPAIVVGAAVALSGVFFWLYNSVIRTCWNDLWDGRVLPSSVPALLWAPLVWLGVVALVLVCGLGLPACRNWLRWRLPGFKEGSLSQFASAMNLLLQSGGQLQQALALIQQMDPGPELGHEVARWQERLAAGHGKFAEFAQETRLFPRLFVWLVSQSGENLADGFGRAAEIYFERARHRAEMLLYAALPAAVMILGGVILFQVYCMLQMVVIPLNMLGDGG